MTAKEKLAVIVNVTILVVIAASVASLLLATLGGSSGSAYVQGTPCTPVASSRAHVANACPVPVPVRP